MDFEHQPVLLNEVLDKLEIKADGIYVDCTIGGAGHSQEIVKELGTKGQLIGIDQDRAAMKAAAEKLNAAEPQIDLVRNNYRNLNAVLDDLDINTKLEIIGDLTEFESDNLLNIQDEIIKVKPKGKAFIRNVCMAFDLRLKSRQTQSQLFSMTI